MQNLPNKQIADGSQLINPQPQRPNHKTNTNTLTPPVTKQHPTKANKQQQRNAPKKRTIRPTTKWIQQLPPTKDKFRQCNPEKGHSDTTSPQKQTTKRKHAEQQQLSTAAKCSQSKICTNQILPKLPHCQHTSLCPCSCSLWCPSQLQGHHNQTSGSTWPCWQQKVPINHWPQQNRTSPKQKPNPLPQTPYNCKSKNQETPGIHLILPPTRLLLNQPTPHSPQQTLQQHY